MIALIVPVLPNRAEAWRRFVQELQGSYNQAFQSWCRQLDVQVQHITFNDDLDGIAVVFTVIVENHETALSSLAESATLFDHWLRQRFLDLHGLDLTKMARASRRSLFPLATDV